jgi:Methyltransferase domain
MIVRKAAKLRYESLEVLKVSRPVDRIQYIAGTCKGMAVLDIGCYDETALIKRDTKYWLHGQLAQSARLLVGLDSSTRIPDAGLVTGENARIVRGDGTYLTHDFIAQNNFDTVVAGEFIEHIENPMEFLRLIKQKFDGKQFILSTPNGISMANTLMGFIGREVQHHDHLHVFSYKTLNTLCDRAGFSDWEILPYYFYATEMKLGSKGLKRAMVAAIELGIRLVERVFPLVSFGYIVRIRV